MNDDGKPLIETIVRNLKAVQCQGTRSPDALRLSGRERRLRRAAEGDVPRRFLDKAFDDQLKDVSGRGS
jgi:hypothetical protein